MSSDDEADLGLQGMAAAGSRRGRGLFPTLLRCNGDLTGSTVCAIGQLPQGKPKKDVHGWLLAMFVRTMVVLSWTFQDREAQAMSCHIGASGDLNKICTHRPEIWARPEWLVWGDTAPAWFR
jgi:hypothetical protein